MPGARSAGRRRYRAPAAGAIAVLAAGSLTLAQGSHLESTRARILAAKRIVLGYRTDAQPFSYKNDEGRAAGYAVALCEKVAVDIREALKIPIMNVDWVAVPANDRFGALQQGRIDLLCTAESLTLSTRSEVALSIPIYRDGISALVRADAPVRLREALAGNNRAFRPTWRASPTQMIQARTVLAVGGTPAERWLGERFDDLHIVADRSTTTSYDAGIRAVLDRQSDAFFGERAILADALRRHPSARDLTIVDRLFTRELLAFAMARGDEDFRLLVDRTLSRLYRSHEIDAVLGSTSGEPEPDAIAFFRSSALPE